MSYYPRPAVQAVYPTTNPRRSHAPLEPPPVIPRHQLPRLPSLPRTQSSLPQSLSQTHNLTTHIVTAAFPRTPSELLVQANYAPPPDESKQARKERVQNIYKTFSHKKRRQEKGLPVGQPRREVLYNVFNRYARKGRMDPNGLTLVVTHAVGFPKEIWEPAYAHIIKYTEAQNSGVRVNEIWGFEAVLHGDSALINEGKLGDIFDWMENTRDLINFLLYYLPPTAEAYSSTSNHAAQLPLHLERLPENVAQHRREHGFTGSEGSRRIIGLGHSAGGSAMIMAALFEPKLFHSLILLDPLVLNPEVNEQPIFVQWIKSAIGRRETWSSTEEARAFFASSPNFSYWHHSVLDYFITYAIMQDVNGPPGSVKLKCPGYLEATFYNEKRCGTETWESLARVDEAIEIKFVYSGKGSSATGGDKSTIETAWRRPINVSNVKLPLTHLMVQESPSLVADAIVEFLQVKYGSTSHGRIFNTGAAKQVEARL